MSSSIFWIFGRYCGYCFADPLIPLCVHPQLLWLMPYVGTAALQACIVVSSYCWALAISVKKKRFVGIGSLALLPFMGGLWQPLDTATVPSWYQHICYVSPPKKFITPLDCAQEITKNIQDIAKKKPNATLFLMPESSFPFYLDQMSEILELWELNALDDQAILILGGHMHNEQKDQRYNVLFVVQESRITHHYVKTTYMFFTEFVPFPWNSFSIFHKLFLKNKKEFSLKKRSADLIQLNDDIIFEPAICSDLFIGKKNRYETIPLICLINDSWFSCSYFRTLMLLFAQYFALRHKRTIFYIAHSQGLLIDKSGIVHQW